MVERAFEAVLDPDCEPMRRTDAETVPPSVVDALMWPAETARWLTRCPVGSEAVAALAVIDPWRLPHEARIDLLVAGRRLQAWLAGLEQRTLASLGPDADDAPVDPSSGTSWVTQEIAAALRLAGRTAGSRLDTAIALNGPLAGTGAALTRGEITYLQAAAIADETRGLTAEQRHQIEISVLPVAGRCTVGELRRRSRRAVSRIAPEDDEQLHRRGYRERRVTIRPHPDGMASVWALLPADEAQALFQALTALADRDQDVPDAEGAPRTRDQRRADALGGMAWSALADPDLPRRHDARPTITVAVALSTLLGCDQQPATLTGHGAIPAAMARRIAAAPNATWRRLIVDPAGRPLDYGRTTYRPPADLRDFVINRDRHCVFPGCTRHARDADLDHHTAWNAGGTTDPDNVGPLCPLHHRMKHEAGWTIRREPTGHVIWTSPTGHTYVADPDPYPVDDWTEWQPEPFAPPGPPPGPDSRPAPTEPDDDAPPF